MKNNTSKNQSQTQTDEQIMKQSEVQLFENHYESIILAFNRYIYSLNVENYDRFLSDFRLQPIGQEYKKYPSKPSLCQKEILFMISNLAECQQEVAPSDPEMQKRTGQFLSILKKYELLKNEQIDEFIRIINSVLDNKCELYNQKLEQIQQQISSSQKPQTNLNTFAQQYANTDFRESQRNSNNPNHKLYNYHMHMPMQEIPNNNKQQSTGKTGNGPINPQPNIDTN